MRVFLDTNVLASALMGRGLCQELLDRLVIEHEVLLGAPVREELERVVAERFRAPAPLIEQMSRVLDGFTQVPGSALALPEVSDPDDVPILACALAAEAELFVTGDKALLDLRAVRGLPIVSPRECWERLMWPPQGAGRTRPSR